MTHQDCHRWAATLPLDGPGCRVVESWPDASRHDRDAALTALGYLVIDPDAATTTVDLSAAVHRHVALTMEDGLTDRGRHWLRALSWTSPRAHLVLARPPRVSVARERAVAWEPPGGARRARAVRFHRARRPETARAWMRAALAAAARRRDAVALVRLLVEAFAWVRQSGGRHDVYTLLRLASDAMAWIDEGEARAPVAAVAARLRGECGDLDAAWAWLAGVAIEWELGGEPVPAVVTRAQCDLALWLGWWDEATRRLPREAADGEVCRDLLRWVRGAGSPEAASRWLEARAIQASPLAQLARAALADDPAAPAAAVRVGAQGIAGWCRRRAAMGIWGGVSALLDEINGADDDLDALRRGVRWVRAHTGTARVVVLEAAADTPLWADPDGSVPGPDDLRAPVRQAGVTIAWVAADPRARDREELAGAVRALASACAPAVRARLDAVRLAAGGDTLAAELVGRSPAMTALRTSIARVASTAFPVLIEGESGAGKELVARAVHRLSARRDRRFAAINCAALTDELFDAEVFGHTRGAFTGAVGGRVGLFEDAHQGTLFLDEVAELSARAQAKLLRVLQDGEVRRVGDNHGRAVDVRIVAATNRPLAAAAAAGQFREDLVFRLAVVRLAVPPLRERIEDIPALALTCWAAAVRHRDTRAWLGPDALAALCRHAWPGNVRELQNVIAGLVVAAPLRGRVTARHVAEVLRVSEPGAAPIEPLDTARRRAERTAVCAALARHGGCRTQAARDLGVTRQGLGKLMARLGVSAPEVASRAALR